MSIGSDDSLIPIIPNTVVSKIVTIPIVFRYLGYIINIIFLYPLGEKTGPSVTACKR